VVDSIALEIFMVSEGLEKKQESATEEDESKRLRNR
jgi:hypothetical protein